jgi:hypothetical protein
VDVPPDAPRDRWPKADPAGGGYVQMANGVHVLMDARAPGPRVFEVSGTTGKIFLFNDLRQVQLWRKQDAPGAPGVVDLVPGPLLASAQEQSYALAQMAELLDVLDGGAATSCNEVQAARALEIVLGLHLSHRAGGARIRFPLTDRSFAVDTV